MRLPKFAGSTTRRSTGSPVCVRPRAACSLGADADSIPSTSASARTSAPGSLAVAMMSRSLTESAWRRAEPASSTRSDAGCARSAATICSPTFSARCSSTRCAGRSATPAASDDSTDSSNFAPKPLTSRSRCCSAAAFSICGDSIPSSVNRRRARLGPSPGRRVISSSPAGYLPRSFSSAGIVPVSSSATSFSSSVLPIPASSVTRPWRVMPATDTIASRALLAALR